MSINEINQEVATIREYTRIKEEAEAMITAAQDKIKEHMKQQETDEINGTDYKITWHTVSATRFDQAQLKKDHPDIAAKYTVPNPYKRFLLK